jgi:hypothetical protein
MRCLHRDDVSRHFAVLASHNLLVMRALFGGAELGDAVFVSAHSSAHSVCAFATIGVGKLFAIDLPYRYKAYETTANRKQSTQTEGDRRAVKTEAKTATKAKTKAKTTAKTKTKTQDSEGTRDRNKRRCGRRCDSRCAKGSIGCIVRV